MLHRTAVLMALLVFGGLGQTPSFAEYVYWTDKDTATIQSSRPSGYGLKTVLSTADGLIDPRGIALNVADNWMYWADNGTNNIRRARLDGSAPQDVVTGLSFPADLALDLDAGKIYWADRDANEIRRANLDGSNPQAVQTGIVQPYYLALDPAQGKVYWSDFDSPTIHRANMNGSGGVENLSFLTGLSRVRDLAIDSAAGKIYWADRDSSKIQRANLDGSGGIEDLYAAPDGLDRPHGLAIDRGHGKIYWTDTTTHSVMQGSMDGSSIASAVNSAALSDGPWGIALDILQLDHSTSIDSRFYGDLHTLDGPLDSSPTVVELTESANVPTLETFGASTVTISGGSAQSVVTSDTSTLNLLGGSVEWSTFCDSSTVNMLGGFFGETMLARDSSVVNISGGSMSEFLSANDASIVTFVGSGFNYPYGEIPDRSGSLTGTLANGDPINVWFDVDGDASIVLAVPEPSSVALLATAAFGLVGYAWRRRRVA
jgi:DNA-binding beta-propeller fold protein YncE